MKTLVVGDSFVANKIDTYAKFLQDIEPGVDVKGLSGGGNDIISYQLLCELKKYDRFVINWTSTCRYDVLVSDEIKKKLFNNNCNHHFVNNHYFVNSGGWRGNWTKESTKDMFDGMYKYHFDIENSWRTTLQNMLLVHKLLQGKPHINFFSYDTFENVDFGAYEKNQTKHYNKSKWMQFKQKNSWLQHIDWDKVWFHKNSQTETGGVMDWCHDNTEDNGHHPSAQGAKAFLQTVLIPWLSETHN